MGLCLAAFVSLGTTQVVVELQVENLREAPIQVRVTDGDGRTHDTLVPPGQTRSVYYRSTGGCETIHADGSNLEIEKLEVRADEGELLLSLTEDELLERLRRGREFRWVLRVA